jgi:hypothetical protein
MNTKKRQLAVNETKQIFSTTKPAAKRVKEVQKIMANIPINC